MNADLAERAVVVVGDGWREVVLEDAGERRTEVIALPAGARLPVAIEGGTLDVLVLAGDLAGFASGAFITAPAAEAARLAWATRGGCTLFVKHRPVAPPAGVRSAVIANVRFSASNRPGMDEALLYADRAGPGRVVLLRFAPGTTIGTHRHDLGEELLVLEGELTDERGTYRAHTWVRQPPDSEHAVSTPEGALLLTYAHHLR